MRGTVGALVCTEATVRYGRVTALDRLDLDVQRSRITALVGPNGAGKTTALRLAAGLVRPTTGHVRVLGIDPVAEPVAARRKLGLLPDRPTLPTYLGVDELLRLRAAMFGLTGTTITERTKALSDELHIRDLLTRRCGALSHGQAQRAALAAVLLPRPHLLLVDEPMTALDLTAQHLVRRALRRRANDGAAVVLTTHTVAHVAALADTVVLLEGGRVRASRDGTRDAETLERWLLDVSC